MDRGKKSSTSLANKNNRIYMDLKDIIRENALCYLPAKSLRRCTGVCRDWKFHISTPFFAHSQSNSFRDVSGFFCQSSSSLPSFVSLDPIAFGVPDPSLKFLPEPVDIRCSTNGLLCCQGQTGYNAYYICNPVTKQWKKLPKPDGYHGADPALVLVFEPTLLNFVAEYTLICAFPSDLDGYEFEIYSSNEASWRTSREICFGNRQIVPRSGVHVDGTVYWKSINAGIIAFDLKTERSKLLPGCNACSYYSSGALGEVNKKLCYAFKNGTKVTLAELSNAFTNTMQMNNKTKAWTMKDVSLTLDNAWIDGWARQGSVLFVGGDVMVIHLGKTLVPYNMRTKEVKQLTIEDVHDFRMVPYVNSLVDI
ncbi:hypothetical protein JCGZ_05162 [Jatropha curcas]|uniref:F-box protein At3g26010-like beta-propeller domain-containing protein n=1 Tax=Jatropha curcas TaxID=180498 RepID=A0A067KQ11_JATCU|nr:F-box protein At5g07610 [Jatropha curcas]XP_012072029.1 F-box protein At5g07610 [Jatropha curcas]XP_037492361.1 F-box protein At5g07610 [Jatropha curcas]KDP38276.1 hypothetical protein JCGZ_05162 [Jatropha curcas]